MGRPRKRQNSCGSSYRQGCRCAECRREHADDALEYAARRALNGGRPLLEGKPDVQHGDITMYGRGCKCELCMRAMREKSLEYRYGAIPERPEHCECCGVSAPLVVDHDHDSGKFRGWLCHSCNTGIGMLGDDVDGLLIAVEYLLKSGSVDGHPSRSSEHGNNAMWSRGCRCEACVSARKFVQRTQYSASKSATPPPEDCQCCGKGGLRLVVDHSHQTGEFRGWICRPCNMGIGRLGEGAAGISVAIDYLEGRRKTI